MNDTVFKNKAKKLGINDNDIKKILNLNNSRKMNDKEVKDFIISSYPFMEKIFDVWNNSMMKSLNLTSVGIAIGHANVKRNLGEFTDLSIWIN